jgi:serine/threonine protein kinase
MRHETYHPYMRHETYHPYMSHETYHPYMRHETYHPYMSHETYHSYICHEPYHPYMSHETYHPYISTGYGTPAWTAPEVFMGKAPTHYASDVYSTGVVLWEIATRAYPWKGKKFPEIISAVGFRGERPVIGAARVA